MKQSILYFLFLLFPVQARAGETIAAVLSSPGGAYLEAFAAFQAAYGAEVRHHDISKKDPELPPGVRTVAAFGNKAAGYSYPAGLNMVYCLSPGFFVKNVPAGGRAVKISMIPQFGLLLPKLKLIQPGLKRLRIFWTAPVYELYADLIQKESRDSDIVVELVRVKDPEALPGLLRQSMGKMDAFWLPPDPLLVTRESLMIFREFSWANAIPFYASVKGMVQEGAVASIGVSFKEIGRTAARAALRLEAGEDLPWVVFAGNPEITLNAAAAKKCGIEFPGVIRDEAAYLFP